MSSMPHIPAIRRGKLYASLDKVQIVDHRRGAPMVAVSQINSGIIRRDLARKEEAAAVLKKFSVSELIQISARAGELFLNGTLPLGDQGHTQSPDLYVEQLSATSGLPFVLVRRNMAKIHHALTHMDQILRGLTRGLELEILDRASGRHSGVNVSYYRVANALGLVMPSNSPAVNSLWLPAIALKTPVVIKPGREEPWTPYRLIQAFISAGCPPEAFCFYPTDHAGAGEILRLCDRSLIFGDKKTTAQYAHQPGIQIHGPGFSKILIGEDQADHWSDHLEVMVSSIGDNGGRSCINASAILTPRHPAEIADALARRMAAWEPRSPEDPEAKLAGFANPKMAEFIDEAIEEGLKIPGAEDVTAKYRRGPRKVIFAGGVYLRPTVIHCDSFDHPLANREYLFPYAAVTPMPQEEMLGKIGPTLAVTALTKDPAFTERLLECRQIERLNLGPISTMNVSWDQPHEGNMFEFLYRRRSLERAWPDITS